MYALGDHDFGRLVLAVYERFDTDQVVRRLFVLGVLATLVLLFFFLPAWMQLWPMKEHSKLDGDAPKAEDLALPLRWRQFLQGVLGYNRLVFATLAVVMIVCGIGLTQIKTLIKLTEGSRPVARSFTTRHRWLEEKLGPLVPLEVVVRLDNKSATSRCSSGCSFCARCRTVWKESTASAIRCRP